DDRRADAFLPAFDRGHLIGDQFGAKKVAYNLVPMGAELNRGGNWNSFETKVGNFDYCVVLIRCLYDNTDDGRIPTTVKARGLRIQKSAFEYFSAGWDNLRMIPQLGVDALWNLKKDDSLLSHGLTPTKYPIQEVVEGLVNQEPLHVVKSKYVVD